MGRRQSVVHRDPYRTLLIVGEGDAEIAFLSHLKTLYVPRGSGVRVTLRNAHGKGPGHVIDFAVRQARQFDFDSIAVLLDTDLPWPAAAIRAANALHLVLIASAPCLDGLLLQLLGRRVPPQSAECKQIICQLLPGRSTDPDSYGGLFPQTLLDARCATIEPIARLRALMRGQGC